MSLKYASNVFIGLRDVESVWDGLVERAGSREERERKKKTREWISAARSF